MEIGDKVIRTPITFTDPEKGGRNEPQHKPMKGTVVYIHPEGRYHTVEFELPGGKVRENFTGE